ncbi:MAG: hypothetical protein O7C75_09120 [Verrucomicrobia bacterium]|nr:hypothetical protein [Verrucomicrobiota bacterium]
MTDDVFEDLVNLYLDKEINPAQLSILRGELDRNSNRRKTFESYCRMHQATHFAALSACPVIPRLGESIGLGKNKPGLFSLHRQVWAAALVILVIGSFATVYLNGPFGSARIVQTKQDTLQKIETFAQSSPEARQPPLEFFRALKAQNESQEWAYVQELRHIRAVSDAESNESPLFFSWSDNQPGKELDFETTQGFELEYSSYEFKR